MKIRIDGEEVDVDKGKTVLEICRERDKEIPTFCHMKGREPESRCRVCIVEVDGSLETSCSTYPKEGMEVVTNSERVLKARERNKKLMRQEKNDSEAYKLFREVGIGNKRFETEKYVLDTLGQAIARNRDKCVNCGNCVKICSEVQDVHAIDFAGRGHEEHVTPYGEKKLSEVSCIRCGQCIMNCDEDAVFERSHIENVEEALEDEDKTVIAQTAPAVRASLGELFGFEAGENVEGRMVTALRELGFDKVFDTVFGADLTIVEESRELIERIENVGPFPLITSCCPSWILLMEHFYPEMRENVSTCKSPHQMVGSLVKNYYTEKEGLDPDDTVVVSVMPCVSKKFESSREEMKEDVDFVLTTRELGKMVEKREVDFEGLDQGSFDSPLGFSTGAGKIFGSSGGVMEAALRTANEKLGGDEKLDFNTWKDGEGVLKGEVVIDGKKIKYGVANGGSNIRKLLEQIEEGEEIHFIEFMACPGGCIGGGGQPKSSDEQILEKRAEALWESDEGSEIRLSHENPAVKKIYSDFLGEPLSEKSEELLHTFYLKRDRF